MKMTTNILVRIGIPKGGRLIGGWTISTKLNGV